MTLKKIRSVFARTGLNPNCWRIEAPDDQRHSHSSIYLVRNGRGINFVAAATPYAAMHYAGSTDTALAIFTYAEAISTKWQRG